MPKINYKGFILSERMSVREFVRKSELIPYSKILLERNGLTKELSISDLQIRYINHNGRFEISASRGELSFVVEGF